MVTVLGFWRKMRAKLGLIWRQRLRPACNRRNVPYFVFLALLAFLITTSLMTRRRSQAAPVKIEPAAVAPASEEPIHLGQSPSELESAWLDMLAAGGETDSAEAVAAGPGSFTAPVGVLSQGRGWRKNEQDGTWVYHRGVDLTGASGRDVAAITPGKVTRIANDPEGGLRVEIDHGGGWVSILGGLTDLHVKVGDRAAAGGIVGRTLGTELHLEIREGDILMDPIAAIPGIG